MSPRRTRVARTSRSRPARRARLLTRRAKLNAARRPRRGVLLLVVLSLLVLFLMVGTAFVITAKQSEKAAKSSMKAAVRIAGEAAQADLLDEVLHQIIRDTNNPHSSLRFHSLLGDMYGNDGLKGVILPTSTSTNPPPPSPPTQPPRFAGSATGGADPGPTGGQMLEFQVGTQATGITTAGELLRDLYGNVVDAANNPLAFSNIDNAYNGQILTFLSGAAKGRSTRIVGFIPPNTFRVMNFQLEDGSLVSNPTTQLAAARVLINGRPFSGTGAGLNNNARDEYPKLTAREVVAGVQVDEEGLGVQRDPLLSLMPNTAFYNPDKNSIASDQSEISATRPKLDYLPMYGVGGFADWNGRGGANESYDAPDFQNMFLGFVTDEPNRKEFEDPDSGRIPSPDIDEVGIPSFHRPDLLYWWRAQFPTSGGDELALKPMLLRKILMRPNWLDHKNFTGSNPEYALIVAQSNNDPSTTPPDEVLKRMILGPWDVDNDNNGFRDSVWVDVGLPVMAGPNGKLVKPLAAILCVDMDGRLQANAHGTCDLANAWTGAGTGLTAMATPGVALNQAGVTSDQSPRGLGYGPAEITLGTILDQNRYQRLLVGEDRSGVFSPGRYGYRAAPAGGGTPIARPGVVDSFDVLSQISMNGLPNTPDGIAGNRLATTFSNPPDLRARYGLWLNRYGQPLLEATLQGEVGTPSAQLASDSPYELNLSSSTAAGVQGNAATVFAADAPFSPAELERLLRMYDSDAGALPSRLTDFLGIDASSEQLRQRLATEAFDLPTPNVSLPHEMESLLSTQAAYRRMPRSAADLIEMRVRGALGLPFFPEPLAPADAVTVRGVMRRIVASELANGERLNLNRPLGPGRDYNDNGVVDEPGESGQIWNLVNAPAGAAARFAEALFPPMASEIVPHPTDPANNPHGVLNEIDHRYLLARDVYVLALTLTAPENYCIDLPAGSPPTPRAATDDEKELARRLAQWAVNVVDYRDPDNIMTGFEYDVNPFDGWGVDGIVGQNSADDANTALRSLVWGAERPELLMTETLAWHDRRSDDRTNAYTYPDGKRDTELAPPNDPDQNKDKDYDQFYRPRGALFVELHNPWPATPAVNEDTHAATTQFGARVDLGVDLGRTHDNSLEGSPVWRMAVYKRKNSSVLNAANWDPDSQLPADRSQQPDAFPLHSPSQDLDRSVYFCGPRAAFPQDSPAFFNDEADPVPPVRPGRLLVVGPGEDRTSAGVYESYIGDKKRTATGSPRRIELHRNNGESVTLRGSNVANRTARPAIRLSGAAANIRMADADDATINDMTANLDMETVSEVARQKVTNRTELKQHELAFPSDPSESTADVAIVRKASMSTTGKPLDQATVVDRPLSVSEPARGYPERFLGSRWDAVDQCYRDAQRTEMPLDVPLDGPIGGEAALEAQFGPLDAQRVGENGTPNWPKYLARFNPTTRTWESTVDPVLTTIPPASGTQHPGASYSFIYLQRLANPLLPWNPEPGDPNHNSRIAVNPYFTVDSMPVNLTVFNSRAGEPDGNEERGESVNQPGNKFASFERGYTADKNKKAGEAMAPMMTFEFPSGTNNTRPDADVPLLEMPRNRLRQAPLNRTTSFKFNRVPAHTLGMLNLPFQANDPALTEAERKTQPRVPFEWLPWNNRPYVSGNEAMLVPRTSTSELFRRTATGKAKQAAATNWSYDPAIAERDDRTQTPSKLNPFNQLENFFAGEPSNGSPTPGAPVHLYRVLEYLHTPSLFAGTRTWLNPSASSQQLFGVDSTQFADSLDPRIRYQAPFNSVSEFRDPGSVNINTIHSENVYQGLFHGDQTVKAHQRPTWDNFNSSRRGDALEEPFQFNSASPAFVGNPFRSPDAGDLVPLNSMRRTGVDCTLQRSIDVARRPAPTPGEHVAPGNVPLFAAYTEDDQNDWRRNPYFFLQPMVRLDNLVTTRSNVYAVWVTIGFFEVEEAPNYAAFRNNNGNLPDDGATQLLYKQVYPDGYAFGREDGVDVGATRRLRGFYIIDRTKMAGYEPGADHNVENVIRLRRHIE